MDLNKAKGVVMSVEPRNDSKIPVNFSPENRSNSSGTASADALSNSSPPPMSAEKFRLAGWDLIEEKPEPPATAEVPSKSDPKKQVFATNPPTKTPDRTGPLFTRKASPPLTPGQAAPVTGHASGELWERAKSTLRMRYEAEARVIKKKVGDLETIRQTLGVSQRKIAQLLLVDPSAWTRWTRDGEDAPPHIYRALQWYLAVEEKYPALDVNFWLSTVAPQREPVENEARDQRISALGSDLSAMKNELETLRAQAAKAQDLEQRLFRLKKSARLQNFFVMVAAVLGSLLAGVLASRYF